MPSSSFHTILCPVDFSDLSAQALRHAAALARCGNSSLVAAYANSFEVPPYFTQSRIADLRRQLQESRAEAERHLRDFVDSTLGDAGPTVQVRVVEALPADAIQHLTLDLNPDLIVMGTHGRSGVNRWLLGSVAEKVLRQSQIPILTVRGAAPGPVSLQHILCPVNDSQPARRALEFSTRLAACFGATVTAVHVQEPAGPKNIAKLCSWIPSEQRSTCEIRELVRQGEAAQEIISLASEMPCDLMVIGAEHKRFHDSSVLGTTTIRTVRHAPCPVLTVVGAQP